MSARRITSASSLVERSPRECVLPSCEAAAWQEAPLPICERHYIVIARHYETVIRPDINRRVANVGSMIDAEKRHKPPTAVRSTVYFVQLGDRIKIGFSGNVKRRMQDVRTSI
jgi:hypothetical protein